MGSEMQPPSLGCCGFLTTSPNVSSCRSIRRSCRGP